MIVACLAFATGDGCRGRRALLALLVSIWGLRLASYLSYCEAGFIERRIGLVHLLAAKPRLVRSSAPSAARAGEPSLAL